MSDELPISAIDKVGETCYPSPSIFRLGLTQVSLAK